jgi:hypothetical protein
MFIVIFLLFFPFSMRAMSEAVAQNNQLVRNIETEYINMLAKTMEVIEPTDSQWLAKNLKKLKLSQFQFQNNSAKKNITFVLAFIATIPYVICLLRKLKNQYKSSSEEYDRLAELEQPNGGEQKQAEQPQQNGNKIRDKLPSKTMFLIKKMLGSSRDGIINFSQSPICLNNAWIITLGMLILYYYYDYQIRGNIKSQQFIIVMFQKLLPLYQEKAAQLSGTAQFPKPILVQTIRQIDSNIKEIIAHYKLQNNNLILNFFIKIINAITAQSAKNYL